MKRALIVVGAFIGGLVVSGGGVALARAGESNEPPLAVASSMDHSVPVDANADMTQTAVFEDLRACLEREGIAIPRNGDELDLALTMADGQLVIEINGVTITGQQAAAAFEACEGTINPDMIPFAQPPFDLEDLEDLEDLGECLAELPNLFEVPEQGFRFEFDSEADVDEQLERFRAQLDGGLLACLAD